MLVRVENVRAGEFVVFCSDDLKTGSCQSFVRQIGDFNLSLNFDKEKGCVELK